MVYNFNAGPGILLPEVLEDARRALTDFDGTGLSILEIGHRTPAFEAVVSEGQALARELMDLSPTQEVLFLQGGATTQFFQVPMNFLASDGVAAYLDAGIWGSKAVKEARLWGGVEVVGSSREQGYRHIPKGYDIPASAAYLHLTTNNTVEGTQMQEMPDTTIPLVADMSSDILSRPLPIGQFDLIYAGAQKNLGPSGLTLVFIRKDLLALEPVGVVPRIFRYQTHADPPSRYNTPNTFGILVLALVLEWMKDLCGLDALAARNEAKAKRLYDALDASSLFRAHAKPGSRSRMNVTFTLGGAAEDQREALTKRFLSEANAAGFDGLKGHRLVGGCRASIYNAFPQEGVDALVAFMQDFERRA